jgi:hypothetical protein
MVLPSGFATDHGCGALRGYVMDRTTVDTLVAIENRGAIFPIHRGLKFLLLGLTAGGSTAAVPLRAGVRSAEALDRLPDRGTDPDAVPLSRALLERASGPQLAIPEVRSRIDLEILGRAAFTVPALADENGWHVHFGRELNATDDRPHFHDGPDGLPVIEGKLMAPFTVNTAGARYRVAARAASRLLGAGGGHTRARLAYRDVAAATNRLTLIAAILPAGVVSTHTVFCLREPLDEGAQQFLCGMFNSFVANYLVRTRVGTHVTTAIVERLPVPAPPRDDPVFREIAAASRRLAHRQDGAARARLQALSAGLYGLTEEAFAHVLGTFPLVDEGERAAALAAFRCIVGERSGAIHSPPGPRSG